MPKKRVVTIGYINYKIFELLSGVNDKRRRQNCPRFPAVNDRLKGIFKPG